MVGTWLLSAVRTLGVRAVAIFGGRRTAWTFKTATAAWAEPSSANTATCATSLTTPNEHHSRCLRRDAVIETLAASEAALSEQVARLTVERDGYRLLARVALSHVHDVGVELADVRAKYHQARDEARDLRADTILRSSRNEGHRAA